MTWWCFIAFVFWISLHLTWLSIFRSTAQLLFQISGSFPLRPCQQWILWNPRLNCTTQPCFKKVIENAEFTIFLLLNSTLNPTVIITTTTTPLTTSELHSKKVLLIPMILATISTKSSIRMKPLKKSLLKITVWYSFSIMRNNLQMHSSDPPLIKKRSQS